MFELSESGTPGRVSPVWVSRSCAALRESTRGQHMILLYGVCTAVCSTQVRVCEYCSKVQQYCIVRVPYVRYVYGTCIVLIDQREKIQEAEWQGLNLPSKKNHVKMCNY